MTPEDRQRLEDLKQIPLADFCIEKLGYTVRKRSDSRSWRALEAENGEIIIVPSQPGRAGCYFYFELHKSHQGTIIDLLLTSHGCSNIQEILERYCEVQPSYFSQPAKKPAPEPPKYTVAEVHGLVEKRVKGAPLAYQQPDCFLSRKRGIGRRVLETFRVRGDHFSAIFPLWEWMGDQLIARTDIRYRLQPSGETARYFLSGALRYGSFSLLVPAGISLEEVGKAMVFESPIDALSYYQLKRVVALYISTCGRVSAEFLKGFPDQLRQMQVSEVVLALDADEAGGRMTAALRSVLDGFAVSVEVPPPGYKDWNDLLRGTPVAQEGGTVAAKGEDRKTLEPTREQWEEEMVATTKQPARTVRPEWD